MGVLTGLFERRMEPSEQRAHPKDNIDWSSYFGAGWGSVAGVDVTPETSLQTAAVFACVRRIAQDVAGLPFITYRRLERGKERASNHPLYSLLHDVANPEMTAMEFRETVTGHVALRGNGYAEIEFNGAGQVKALWPLRPDKTTPLRAKGSLWYDYLLPNDQMVRLPKERVLHIRGFGFDGIMGYNPVYLAREAVGLSMATEEFGSRFFSNGARPSSILEHPGKLSEDAHGRLQNSIDGRHLGLSNAHRMMILEEGMKLHEVGLAPEDSQFLETRHFELREIARFFDMQPHKIGDLSDATFSNIYEQNKDYLDNTLSPYLRRWEQRVFLSLLSPSERRQYMAEHLVDALLRSDIDTRYGAYSIGIQSGILTRNEVRERENLNPLDGLDEPLQPLNMVVVGQETESEPDADPPTGVDGGEGGTEDRRLPIPEQRAGQFWAERSSLSEAQYGVILDVAARVVRRETNDVGRAIQKYLVNGNDVQGFLLWLSDFYEEHPAFVRRQMEPTFEALAKLTLGSVARELGDPDLSTAAAGAVAVFAGKYVETFALRQSVSSRRQLEKLLIEGVTADGETIADVLQNRLDGWAENGATRIATRESVQAVNASAKAAYRAAGITELEWVASGENCPFCQSLDGKVVGIEEAFVPSGDYQPEGAEAPLMVRRSVGHPPLHSGCDCQIRAKR